MAENVDENVEKCPGEVGPLRSMGSGTQQQRRQGAHMQPKGVDQNAGKCLGQVALKVEKLRRRRAIFLASATPGASNALPCQLEAKTSLWQGGP